MRRRSRSPPSSPGAWMLVIDLRAEPAREKRSSRMSISPRLAALRAGPSSVAARAAGSATISLISGQSGSSILLGVCLRRACLPPRLQRGLRPRARLLHELAVSRGDGSYSRLPMRSPRPTCLRSTARATQRCWRRDLLEMIVARPNGPRRSSGASSGQPAWHEAIGEPNLADAGCDRLLHHAHRVGPDRGPRCARPRPRRGGHGTRAPEPRRSSSLFRSGARRSASR